MRHHHDHDWHRNQPQRRIVFGLFFIVAGVLALLGNLHLLAIGDLADYWPTLFCLAGVLHLMRSRHVAGVLFSLALLLLGAGLTLQNLGVIHHAMGLILPLFLILAGVAVIARGLRPGAARCGRGDPVSERVEHDGRVNMNVTMSGAAMRCDAADFQGGELRAVMGAIELDLRQASLSAQAVLRVFAVCGGIHIRIPPDWTLQLHVAPVLGGVEDKTVPPAGGGKVLRLEGEVIMGGIQIKN
jgi:predicted membrane protein